MGSETQSLNQKERGLLPFPTKTVLKSAQRRCKDGFCHPMRPGSATWERLDPGIGERGLCANADRSDLQISYGRSGCLVGELGCIREHHGLPNKSRLCDPRPVHGYAVS